MGLWEFLRVNERFHTRERNPDRPHHPILVARICAEVIQALQDTIVHMSEQKQETLESSGRPSSSRRRQNSIEDEKCSICFEKLHAQTRVETVCEHYFHIHCIFIHFRAQEDPECPLRCDIIDDRFMMHELKKVIKKRKDRDLDDAYDNSLYRKISVWEDMYEYGRQCQRYVGRRLFRSRTSRTEFENLRTVVLSSRDMYC